MSPAYPENTIDDLAELEAPAEPAEAAAEAQPDGQPSASEFIVESPEALHLRFMMVQDQLRAAAHKVNLLHGLGLSETIGYANAFALYEAKLTDFNGMKARFGV